MNTTTKVLESRIIEPLCNATQSLLRPIQWGSADYVLVEVDDEVERFIISCVAAYPASHAYHRENSKLLFTAAEPMYEHGLANMYSTRQLISRIPERIELGFGKWKIAGTDFSAIVLKHGVPEDKLIFIQPEAKTFFDFLILRFTAQNEAAMEVARFKVDGILPTYPKDFIQHSSLPLNPYQLSALFASLNKDSYALFMEQGTGKTPIAVARVNLEGSRKRVQKHEMYRALVVCPKQVRRNWENEFERFSTTPGKVAVITGGKVRRVKNLLDGIRDEKDCNWSACIISIDSVESTWDAIRRIPWDLVVLDESHYIKSPGTQRFKTLQIFRDLHNGNKRMILTGTPIANTVFDLWAQFEFLDKGLSGFMSFANFKRFHGSWAKQKGTSIERLVGFKAIPLIQERLSRLAYIIKKADANLHLPDKVYDIYEVAMTSKQADYYAKIAEKLALEIEEMLEDSDVSKSLVIENILTKLLRLAQITSGHIRWDESKHVEQIDAVNPKAQAVIDMLTEEGRDPNGKTIVWCCFDEDIRIVSEYLHNAGIKHVGYKSEILEQYRVKGVDEAERVFNKDVSCKVFVANPASGGTGLNLFGYDRDNEAESTTYCDHEIYFSCNWSAINRCQSEDRAHRRGTKCNVRITDLIVGDTIDEEIRKRVKGKINMAASIQDIRHLLNALRGFDNE